MIINGPGNCIALIILLLLDQLHDFFEGSRDKTKKKDYDEVEYKKIVNCMVEKTKNYIENFEYTRNSNDESVKSSRNCTKKRTKK